MLATREDPAAAGGQFEFTVTTDPQQVLDYLHHQTNLPPAKQQKLEEQAQRQELVVWHVTQRPGWNNQQGQAYSMDNGLDRYQWTIRAEGLDFGVFAEKTTAAFNFSAISNAGNTKMVGNWTTPAGRTHFDMQPGQSMMVPVK